MGRWVTESVRATAGWGVVDVGGGVQAGFGSGEGLEGVGPEGALVGLGLLGEVRAEGADGVGGLGGEEVGGERGFDEGVPLRVPGVAAELFLLLFDGGGGGGLDRRLLGGDGGGLRGGGLVAAGEREEREKKSEARHHRLDACPAGRARYARGDHSVVGDRFAWCFRWSRMNSVSTNGRSYAKRITVRSAGRPRRAPVREDRTLSPRG